MWIYGVSSKIPHSFFHYLLMDIDGKNRSRIEWTKTYLEKHGIDAIWKESPNGYHAYDVTKRLTFENCFAVLRDIPNIDLQWLRIGLNRGYWFLADWDKPFLPAFPLKPQDITYMRLKIPEVCSWLSMKHRKN